MFTSQPIGFISSPYKNTKEIPKGLGVKHDVDGVLKILPEFEPGLTDIEGFSHLFVIWEFDRSPGRNCGGPTCSLHRPLTIGSMASLNPISATSEPDWPDNRRTASPRRHRVACARCRYAGWNTDSRHQTLPVERPAQKAAPWMAGRS